MSTEKAKGDKHSIVNISMDTETRKAVLAIDGILVPSDEFHMSQFVDLDGKTQISFGYTIAIDHNGMKERRNFFLPEENEVAGVLGGVDKRGLASKADDDIKEAVADVIDYLAKNRRS